MEKGSKDEIEEAMEEGNNGGHKQWRNESMEEGIDADREEGRKLGKEGGREEGGERGREGRRKRGRKTNLKQIYSTSNLRVFFPLSICCPLFFCR